jgi:hypothetical protein
MIAPPCIDPNCKSTHMAIVMVNAEPYKWVCSVCGKEIYIDKDAEKQAREERESKQRLLEQSMSQNPLRMCRGGDP